MVVEINFLEKKKKKNIVPYLLVVLFLSLIISSGVVLYWQHDIYQQQQITLQDKINTNRQDQLEGESQLKLEEQRLVLSQQVNQLEQELFPSVALLERMIALLPESGYFDMYSFDINDGINISVRVDTLEQVASYNHVLNQEDYVLNVDVSTIQVADTDNVYTASFRVTIDPALWMKEARSS